MTDYAIVTAEGKVTNIVVADRIEDVFPPTGGVAVEVGPGAEIGGTYDGSKFVAKVRPPPPPPGPESKIIRAIRALAAEIDAGTTGAGAKIDALLGAKVP